MGTLGKAPKTLVAERGRTPLPPGHPQAGRPLLDTVGVQPATLTCWCREPYFWGAGQVVCPLGAGEASVALPTSSLPRGQCHQAPRAPLPHRGPQRPPTCCAVTICCAHWHRLWSHGQQKAEGACAAACLCRPDSGRHPVHRRRAPPTAGLEAGCPGAWPRLMTLAESQINFAG